MSMDEARKKVLEMVERAHGPEGWPAHKPGPWSANGLAAFICDVLDALNPEVCVCAAIRLPDGRIVRGQRHSDCIQAAAQWVDHRWRMKLEPSPWSAEMCRSQGFVTSHRRYVDREEGMRLQVAAGIESVAPGGYRGDALFSEDLY